MTRRRKKRRNKSVTVSVCVCVRASKMCRVFPYNKCSVNVHIESNFGVELAAQWIKILEV